jgi:hypothetical protein
MDKVILVYKDVEGNLSKEFIWAEPKGNHFEVRSVPFFAPNIALYDIIATEKDNGLLYFDALVESSGHTTIQIIMFIENEKNRIINNLQDLGCYWEGMHNQMYLAVSIPPNLAYRKIKKNLDKECEKSVLDYKEACISDNHQAEIASVP